MLRSRSAEHARPVADLDGGDDLLVLPDRALGALGLGVVPQLEPGELGAQVVEQHGEPPVAAALRDQPVELGVEIQHRAHVVPVPRLRQATIHRLEPGEVGRRETLQRQPAGQQLQRRDDGVEVEQVPQRLLGHPEAPVRQPLEEPLAGQSPQCLPDGGPAHAHRLEVLLSQEGTGGQSSVDDPGADCAVDLVGQRAGFGERPEGGGHRPGIVPRMTNG